MANISQPFISLAPYIAPQIASCPNPVMTQQIRRAAIELCNNSRYWKRTYSPPITEADTGRRPATYGFNLDPDEDRNQVEWVTWEGDNLEPTTEEQLATKYGGNWVNEQNTTPTHYMEQANRCIALWPYRPANSAQDSPKQVQIRMSLRPSLNASGMDASVMQDCYNVLINGALGFILSMNNQPWTNMELAQGYLTNFQAGVDLYTRRGRDGNVVPNRKVKFNSGY